MHYIYLDNNATTPLDPKVKETLREFETRFGNSSSIHWAGREAKRFLNIAREQVSSHLNCNESEILFTSGGTESINTALCGIFENRPSDRYQIITTPIEHHATLRTLEFLKTKGAEIVYLTVDSRGRIDLD